MPATLPKVDLPSSIKRERAPEAQHKPRTKRTKQSGPTHMCASPWRMVKWRPDDGNFSLQSRTGIDRLATPLGIDESLAFRGFDKTIIFGHWLSKTQKLALASRAFLFEKDFYYILVDYFQKSENVFQKGGARYFHIGFYCFPYMHYHFLHTLYRFPHMLYSFPPMLYNFPSHANLG